MRTYLRLLLSVVSTFILHLSYAQVTLVSDNTYLTGFVLPNGKPLLVSDSTGYLYTTDGTTATTLSTSVASDLSGAIYKNQLYFAGYTSSNDAELWATDGTTSGTKLVEIISSDTSSSLDNFLAFNNTLYFTVNDGTNVIRLWKSDGMANNASVVSTDVVFDSLNTTTFVQNGSYVIFKASDNNGNLSLYTLTSSGISLVKGFSDEPQFVAELGNKTMFTSGGQLWVTDGTTNGTQPIYTLPPFSFISGFTQFKGLLYFNISDSTHANIWATDGTTTNTTLFKTFDSDTTHSPFSASSLVLESSVVFNNKLYFTGYSNSTGYELWSTDGTAANTALVKDINSGSKSSGPFFLFDYGSYLSDAIKNNAVFKFNSQQYFVPFKGKLYFSADDGIHGRELWSTDGTAANTALVKDINPDTTASGISTTLFIEAYYTTNGIYLAADDGITGLEPWVTDGTANGTHLVADINPGRDSSNPQYYFIYNNQLYFGADNGNNNYSFSNRFSDSGYYNLPDLYKINGSTSALPVSLLNFTASKQTASVLLNWVTTNEINTHHFIVERSTDGIHFTEIGTLAALGSSTSKHSYQLNDATAMQTGSTVLYYRLQSVSKDGSYSYSKVLTVQLQNGVFTFTLSPNPVHNQLTVSFSIANTTSAMLRITDASGKQIYQQAYSSSAQSFIQQNISVAKLVSGTYFIQLITNKETKTLKFIKQ